MNRKNITRDASNNPWPPRFATSPASAPQPPPPLPRPAASCAVTRPTSAPSWRSGPLERPPSPLPASTASTPSSRRCISSWRMRRPHRAKTSIMSPRLQRYGWGSSGSATSGSSIAAGVQRQGHAVMAASRSDYSAYCAQHGIRFFRSVDALCEEQPDVVLICSSILSTESVVRAIPFHKLRPDTIVADVLSVKQFPRNLLLEVLPPGFGIICTHPMFGPESGKHGWGSLPFVYNKVRVAEDGDQAAKCDQFLSIFEQEGCRMVEMSCAEHDRYAAGSQFITHTIGRVLSQLNLESTPINTKGYETLLQLTANTVSDSFDLYYGLFMYNVNATEQLDNLERAFQKVRQMLYGRLHDLLRKQIVERVPAHAASSGTLKGGMSSSAAPHLVPPITAEAKKDLSPIAPALQPIASSPGKC